MKRRPIALVLPLLIATTGCGTLFFHNPQMVRVTTNVPGALVIAKNEAILGRIEGTTAEFPLERKKNHTLLVSAHGNEAATVQVESHYSWWRILISLSGDIFLGLIPLPPILWGVVAILPDIGSGAWKVLDDDIHVNLRPRAEPDPAAYAPRGDPTPSVERPASAATHDGKPTCATCGSVHERGAQFCPQCGVLLGAPAGAAKPCHICGEARAASASTCPHCGLK